MHLGAILVCANLMASPVLFCLISSISYYFFILKYSSWFLSNIYTKRNIFKLNCREFLPLDSVHLKPWWLGQARLTGWVSWCGRACQWFPRQSSLLTEDRTLSGNSRRLLCVPPKPSSSSRVYWVRPCSRAPAANGFATWSWGCLLGWRETRCRSSLELALCWITFIKIMTKKSYKQPIIHKKPLKLLITF